jgi:hypothetical protein
VPVRDQRATLVDPLPGLRQNRAFFETDRNSTAQAVRYLRDPVHVVDEASECFVVCIAIELDLVRDFGRYRGVAHEISSDSNNNLIQLDAALKRFAEKVVRNAAGDCKVQELTTVEAAAATTGLDWPIYNQREVTGASQGRYLACEISGLDL